MREKNLQQLREDLARLISLATDVQQEISKPNPDQAPVTVLSSAKEIEKMAKRIARGVR